MKSKTNILLFVSLLFIHIACTKQKGLTVDQTKELFASPTQEEIMSVRLQWQQRNLSPTDFHIVETHSIRPNNILLHIISYRVNTEKQYAGVLVPNTPHPVPVYMYIYGFSLTDPTSRQNLNIDASGTLPFVYVIPALRGQKLEFTVDGVLYRSPVSEGQRNNAFDGAADDAIACLNVVTTHFPQSSRDTAVIRGGSRGGTVALLAAQRDKRFKRAIAVAFPTDLLSLTLTHTNDPTYRFQFMDEFFSGRLTLANARQRLIASSPVFFSQDLPRTQIHYGNEDKITPVRQGEILEEKMQQAGVRDSLAFYIYPGRAHDNIVLNNPELNDRIKLFLADMW